jgi:MSHA pilin protein MshD
MCTRHKQLGISLIELIMFIVIISVALAGILVVMNVVEQGSGDPLTRKQALAIAESLLEEIELMPMTYCDPNDANAATATSTAVCANSEDVTVGPVPAGEARGNAANPFDNVADYGGYVESGITDILGNAIAGMSGYSASVALAKIGTTFIGGAAPAGAALQITVTVTAPNGSRIVVDGIRARYAPNGLP